MFDRVLNTPPTLREKCRIRSFPGLYFPAFGLNIFRILCVSPYSVRMRENADKKNSEYGHFSLSATLFQKFLKIILQDPC